MLVRLGLKQVGDLAGVPRKSLARRFPKDEHPLDALDRALGRKPEPLTPLPDDPPPRALLPLKEPVVHEQASAEALGQLVPRLAAELEHRQLGARHLALTAFRVDGSVGEVEVSTSIPCREPAHLHRLLSGILERQGIDPGFGIDAFALEVRWWERLDVCAGRAARRSVGRTCGGRADRPAQRPPRRRQGAPPRPARKPPPRTRRRLGRGRSPRRPPRPTPPPGRPTIPPACSTRPS